MEHHELVEAVVKLDARVTNLEGWQKSQNGAIHRVEAKVDKLVFWIATAAVSFAGTMIVLAFNLIAKR